MKHINLLILSLCLSLHTLSAQTTIGAYLTTGLGRYGGLGKYDIRQVNAPCYGIGFTFRTAISPRVFFAADPSIRKTRMGYELSYTANNGNVYRNAKFITVFNHTCIPVYAGFSLLKEGFFKPWLGVGITFDNTIRLSRVKGGEGYPAYAVPIRDLLLMSYAGFDMAAGKSTLSFQAAFSPYYLLAFKQPGFAKGFSGTASYRLNAAQLRLAFSIPITDKLAFTPALEALTRPLSTRNELYNYGYLGVNAGLTWKL